LRCIF